MLIFFFANPKGDFVSMLGFGVMGTMKTKETVYYDGKDANDTLPNPDDFVIAGCLISCKVPVARIRFRNEEYSIH